jgi:hypothetical protein
MPLKTSTHRVNDGVITSRSVILDHVDDLERLVISGVDGVECLVVRVDGSVNREVLGLLNVEVELLQTSEGNLLQHLPFGSDSDRPIPDSLGLYRMQKIRGRCE